MAAHRSDPVCSLSRRPLRPSGGVSARLRRSCRGGTGSGPRHRRSGGEPNSQRRPSGRRRAPAEPFGAARPCPRGQFLACPGPGGRRKRIDQAPRSRGNIVDGGFEDRGVRLRRFREAGNLPHELKRRRAHLFVRGGRLEVEQRVDVAAHSIILEQDGSIWEASRAVIGAARSTTAST